MKKVVNEKLHIHADRLKKTFKEKKPELRDDCF